MTCHTCLLIFGRTYQSCIDAMPESWMEAKGWRGVSTVLQCTGLSNTMFTRRKTFYLASLWVDVGHGVFPPVLIEWLLLLSLQGLWIVVLIHTILQKKVDIRLCNLGRFPLYLKKGKWKKEKWGTHRQTLKSSLAWAPLLSFLCSAEWMVWTALSIRFCSSSVSTRSVFHTIPGKTHSTAFVETLWTKRTWETVKRKSLEEEWNELLPYLCQRSWSPPWSGKFHPSCRSLPSGRHRYGTRRRGPALSTWHSNNEHVVWDIKSTGGKTPQLIKHND